MPTRKDCLLRLADVSVTFFILTPLTVIWWAGTWQLIDSYVYQQSPWTSYWVSLAVGNIICILGYILNPCLVAGFVRGHRPAVSLVAIWLFNYVYSIGMLSTWRGVWSISDVLMKQLAPHSLTPLLVVLLLSELALIALRANVNTLTLPFWINLEVGYKFSVATPRFRNKIDDIWWYCCDVLVTHVLITPLVVQVWRGVWHVVVLTLSPDFAPDFHSRCAAVGAAACLLLHSLSYPLYLLAHRLSATHRLLEHLFEVLVTILAAVASLVLWVAVWQLLKEEVIQGVPWRAGLCHGLGFLALALLQASSCLAPTVMGVDGEARNGLGVWWHVGYVNAWIHRHEQPTSHSIAYGGSIQRDRHESEDGRAPLIAPDAPASMVDPTSTSSS